MTQIIANAQDKLLTMGDLFYCTDDVDFASIPKLTGTNQSTVKAALDTMNYSTVGHINNLGVAHALQNEEIIRVGNCGVGEIGRFYEKTPTITFNWLDVNNRPVFDSMLGLDRLAIAASPVAVTGEVISASGIVPKGGVYHLKNKNGANTIVASIVVKQGSTPLVLNTGYTVAVDTDGSVTGEIGTTFIVFITDTPSAVISVDYSYTPSLATLDGYNIEKNAGKYGLFKFVSCKNPINDTQAIQDTIYFWKYILSGELREQYVDLSSSTFAGVDASFVGVTGGGYLKHKATVSL